MKLGEGRNLLSLLGVVVLLAAAPALAQKDSAKADVREDLTIDPASVMVPWTGDLDGMIERRMVRVLVTPSKMFYFQDRGRQRGATYDGFRLMERLFNEKLEKEKKLKQKHLKVRFVFIPMRRDELLPALVAGKGDIAAANLTVTPERSALVDFAAPVAKNVREVVLTGPASAPIATLDDLAGKQVFVRKSSSYYDSLIMLNQRFAAEKKPPVVIKEAPEQLEDEDIIEMVNAGLAAATAADEHVATLWSKVFPAIKVHRDIAVRTGGEIAWAIRKDSPQLKAGLNRFVAAVTTGKYASEREQILTRYLKSTRSVKK